MVASVLQSFGSLPVVAPLADFDLPFAFIVPLVSTDSIS